MCDKVKGSKEEWITEKCKEAEAVAIKNDSKTLYNKLRKSVLVHLRNHKSEEYLTIRTTCSHPTKPLKTTGKNTVRPCTTTSYSQTHQSFKNFSQMAIMKRNHHSRMVAYSEPCIGWRMENHLAQMVFRQNCWRLVEQQLSGLVWYLLRNLGLRILARTMDSIHYNLLIPKRR